MTQDVDKMSFEEAFSALNETLEQLESGDMALDESIKLYEYGMALAKRCNIQLDDAELRVQKLAPSEDFEPDDEF